MKIIELLNNIYPENNNGNSIDKSYQPEENSRAIKPFKQAIEELLGESVLIS